jgi:hypothetical protein
MIHAISYWSKILFSKETRRSFRPTKLYFRHWGRMYYGFPYSRRGMDDLLHACSDRQSGNVGSIGNLVTVLVYGAVYTILQAPFIPREQESYLYCLLSSTRFSTSRPLLCTGPALLCVWISRVILVFVG